MRIAFSVSLKHAESTYSRIDFLFWRLARALQFRKAPEPVNTPELPIASDTAADSLLVDVQRVDSSIIVELDTRRRTTSPERRCRVIRAITRTFATKLRSRCRWRTQISTVTDSASRSSMLIGRCGPARRWSRGRRKTIAPIFFAMATSRARSRHNLGVAVDCHAHRPRDRDARFRWERRSTPSHPRPTPRTRAAALRENRKRLKTAMERHGFQNYEKEWWHFSYDVQNPVRFDRVIQ